MSTDDLATNNLNAAYEALENMRKHNVEVECGELGIPFHRAYLHQCTNCVIAKAKVPSSRLRRLLSSDSAVSGSSVSSSQSFPRIRKLVEDRKIASVQSPQCLICGSPACRSHSSQSFRKENITVCCQCEELFEMDFVVDCLIEKDSQKRQKKIDRMIDSYDRALLLLRYSSQYIDQVSNQLQERTGRQNKVGLGSSSAGIVSGALGIAAAATILTPAGPPLLIASLLFGGSATAVQTGTEAMNYFSEPNQLADRILALHGVLLSILRTIGVLRDAMLLDKIRTDPYDPATSSTSKDQVQEAYERHRGTLLGGLTIGRYSMAGVEISRVASVAETGAVAGRNARFFSRTGTSIMRTARFARFAGGALSAAVLLIEAKSMSNTICAMMEGNPCEKAERLRAIHSELDDLPDTKALDQECMRYLQSMNMRQRAMTEEEVARVLLEQNQLAMEEAKQLELEEASNEAGSASAPEQDSSILLEGEDQATDTTCSLSNESRENMSLSLLERIERYKQYESSKSVDGSNTSPVE